MWVAAMTLMVRLLVYGVLFCAAVTLSIIYLRRGSPLALVGALPAGHFGRMFYLSLRDHAAPPTTP